MMYPSLEQLTRGIYNRYEIVIATAKAAREITDIRYSQREEMIKDAENDNFEQGKTYRKTDYEITDEKAVKTAILKIYNGKLIIIKDERK